MRRKEARGKLGHLDDAGAHLVDLTHDKDEVSTSQAAVATTSLTVFVSTGGTRLAEHLLLAIVLVLLDAVSEQSLRTSGRV